jgi:hypothetical protein
VKLYLCVSHLVYYSQLLRIIGCVPKSVHDYFDRLYNRLILYRIQLRHLKQYHLNYLKLLIFLNYSKNQNHDLIYIGSNSIGTISHMRLSGTVFQFRADLIKSAAFNKPNPNLEFTLNPAPFVFQPAFPARDSYCEVHVTKCCMSRHVKFGLER